MNLRTKFLLIVTISMVLSMSLVAYSDDNADSDNTDSIVIEKSGEWTVDEYVDDFGDGTGIKYA